MNYMYSTNNYYETLFSYMLSRSSIMSGSLARIPIHRCPSTSILKPKSRPVSVEMNLANVCCNCPDTLFNYVPHKLCMKSNLYTIVDNYLFHHPSLITSASYI